MSSTRVAPSITESSSPDLDALPPSHDDEIPLKTCPNTHHMRNVAAETAGNSEYRRASADARYSSIEDHVFQPRLEILNDPECDYATSRHDDRSIAAHMLNDATVTAQPTRTASPSQWLCKDDGLTPMHTVCMAPVN